MQDSFSVLSRNFQSSREDAILRAVLPVVTAPLPVPVQLFSRLSSLGQFILSRNTGVVWKQCAIKIFLRHKIF